MAIDVSRLPDKRGQAETSRTSVDFSRLPDKTPSILGAFGRAAGRGAVPAIGGLAGAARGALLAAPIPIPGARIAGGLIGGLAGAGGLSFLQEKLLKTIAPEFQERLNIQQAKDIRRRPFASALGGIAPLLAGFRPGLINAPGIRGQLPAVLGGGIGVSTEVAPALVQGRDIDPAQVLARGLAGAFLNKPTRFGQRLGIPAQVPAPQQPAKTPSARVLKITQALKEAKPIRAEQEVMFTKERGVRLAKMLAVRKKVGGEEGFKAELGQLKGELPKAQFESIRSKLSQEDIDGLYNDVNLSGTDIWDQLHAKTGLSNLLRGKLPTRSELSILNEVFGSEFTSAALSNRTTLQKFSDVGVELFNLPRAIKASFDLSAPLRQGLFLIGRPKQWIPAFRSMFGQFASEKSFLDNQAQIKARSTFKLMKEHGLSLTEIGANVLAREEAFMSRLGERIPLAGLGVKASNRAYVGFLNKLRADTFDDLLKKGQSLGIADDPTFLPSVTRFINAATGRGNLGSLESSAVALNTIFFSPRLLFSRLNLLNPVFYTRLNPVVRKEALKSLFTLASTGASVLGLAKLNGLEVGTDPRSADFGKIKVGNTRFDIWGGFQQMIVAATRLITGEMVSSTTGREFTLGEGFKATTREDIGLRFLQSKQSPIFSLMTTFLKGETFTGQKPKVSNELIELFVPMFLSDVFEVIREHGPARGWMAVPGAFGVGMQTYGRILPLLEKTASGRATVRFRGEPTAGESIANFFSGEQVSNIPEEFVSTLQKAKEIELSRKLDIDKAKRLVLETGRPRRVGNTTVFLENGILKTKNFGGTVTPTKVLEEILRRRSGG